MRCFRATRLSWQKNSPDLARSGLSADRSMVRFGLSLVHQLKAKVGAVDKYRLGACLIGPESHSRQFVPYLSGGAADVIAEDRRIAQLGGQGLGNLIT